MKTIFVSEKKGGNFSDVQSYSMLKGTESVDLDVELRVHVLLEQLFSCSCLLPSPHPRKKKPLVNQRPFSNTDVRFF